MKQDRIIQYYYNHYYCTARNTADKKTKLSKSTTIYHGWQSSFDFTKQTQAFVFTCR